MTIPAGVKKIDPKLFKNIENLTEIIVDPDNTAYSSINGVLYTKDQKQILAYPCKKTGAYTILSGVTSIRGGAFENCAGLTGITIPSGVTSIGIDAFRNCTALEKVTVPDTVTSIGDKAFENTKWLNDKPDGLVYAGKVAYKYKGSMPERMEIVLKNGTTGIAGYAFDYCSYMTGITIPGSVKCIGARAL